MDAERINFLEPIATKLDGVYLGLYSRKVAAGYRKLVLKQHSLGRSLIAKERFTLHSIDPDAWDVEKFGQAPTEADDPHSKLGEEEVKAAIEDLDYRMVAYLGGNKMLVAKDGAVLKIMASAEAVEERGPNFVAMVLNAYDEAVDSVGKPRAANRRRCRAGRKTPASACAAAKPNP